MLGYVIQDWIIKSEMTTPSLIILGRMNPLLLTAGQSVLVISQMDYLIFNCMVILVDIVCGAVKLY